MDCIAFDLCFQEKYMKKWKGTTKGVTASIQKADVIWKWLESLTPLGVLGKITTSYKTR